MCGLREVLVPARKAATVPPMRQTIALPLLALFCLLPLPAAVPAAGQDGPAGFTCTFTRGTSQSYGKGVFRERPVRPLSFEIVGIDLDGQSAELVTQGGKGPLRIVRAIGANHFLEVVTEGFLNMTTIYDRDAERGFHPAVHSRHFGLFGEPFIAQYTGRCRPK